MKMTPRIAGTTMSLAVAAMAIAAGIIGSSYGVYDDGGRIAGGFLPTVTAAIVAITALIDARARFFSAENPESEKKKAAVDIFGRNQKTRNRQLVAVLILTVVALFLVNVIGFLFAFALLIATISYFVEKKKFIPTALITGATILVAYLVFDQFLQVPLPLGIFGG
jgi:putative tricarboxylic transport membrane protein